MFIVNNKKFISTLQSISLEFCEHVGLDHDIKLRYWKLKFIVIMSFWNLNIVMSRIPIWIVYILESCIMFILLMINLNFCEKYNLQWKSEISIYFKKWKE